VPVGLHVLERTADIVKGKHLVDRQLQFARFLQKPDFPFGLAILAADVAGYSRLMGTTASATLSRYLSIQKA
jgi:hypothetical protein